MRTCIFGGIGLALGLLLAAPTPTRAEDSPLSVVPAKSPIVIQLQGFERTKLRLGAFLGNAMPDQGPVLIKQVDDALKELMGDRDLKVIPKDGRIFGVFSTLEGITESPSFSVILPVKGFNDFRDGFLSADERKSLKKTDDGYYSFKMDKTDETHYLVDRKTWVAVCMDKENAKLYAGGDYAGLDTVLTSDCSKAILNNDLTVYVNLKQINKQYGDQIKGFKALIDLGLGGAQGVDKKQAEMIKEMFNSFIQLMQDGEAFVLALDLRPEGVNLRLQVQFGKDTDTNGFLKEQKPTSFKEIGTLPSGRLSYSASRFDASKSKTWTKLLESAIEDEDEDVKKAIEVAAREVASAGGRLGYSASDGVQTSLEVSTPENSEKLLKAQLKLYQTLRKTSTFGSAPLKDKPKITENAETLGNFKLHRVTMSFDLEKAVRDLPEEGRAAAKAVMMKTLGDGMNVWFGTDGKQYVQVTAKDWLSAKELLVAYLDGKKKLDDDEGFRSTRKQLPEEATGISVMDTARTIEFAMNLAKDALAGAPGMVLPIQIPEIKAPQGKPAYSGMAFTLKDQHGSFDLFVPTSAVQQVRKMFAGLFDN